MMIKHDFSRLRKYYRPMSWILMALALLFTGCAGTGKPQYYMEHYLLNYPAPAGQNRAPVPVSIKFNRFSIAAAYNTASMIFRNGDYSIDTFNYSRWAVNPADMIADDLLRDLRTAGLYQAVFSRYDAGDARFIVSGGVEEFYLRANDQSRTAVIALVISVADAQEPRTGRKMLFQKKYLQEEPLKEASPRGYAQAASAAMQALSDKIRTDIYQAVKTHTP